MKPRWTKLFEYAAGYAITLTLGLGALSAFIPHPISSDWLASPWSSDSIVVAATSLVSLAFIAWLAERSAPGLPRSVSRTLAALIAFAAVATPAGGAFFGFSSNIFAEARPELRAGHSIGIVATVFALLVMIPLSAIAIRLLGRRLAMVTKVFLVVASLGSFASLAWGIVRSGPRSTATEFSGKIRPVGSIADPAGKGSILRPQVVDENSPTTQKTKEGWLIRYDESDRTDCVLVVAATPSSSRVGAMPLTGVTRARDPNHVCPPVDVYRADDVWFVALRRKYFGPRFAFVGPSFTPHGVTVASFSDRLAPPRPWLVSTAVGLVLAGLVVAWSRRSQRALDARARWLDAHHEGEGRVRLATGEWITMPAAASWPAGAVIVAGVEGANHYRDARGAVAEVARGTRDEAIEAAAWGRAATNAMAGVAVALFASPLIVAMVTMR